MTENKPDLQVLPGGKDDNTVEVELNDQPEEEQTFSDEQIEQFYEENKDSIDMIGGLEMLEMLFEINDDQFILLAPDFIKTFENTLSEPQTRSEFRALLKEKGYTANEIADEAKTFKEAIDSIDFLSQAKKDVLLQAISIAANTLQELNNSTEQIVEIPCETIGKIKPPTYANDGDAGLDIYSPKEYTINPGETIIIPTGIRMAIPKGYAILIQPRSGQSAKTKLRIANTPGLIDSGYRDEIGVIIENIEPPFKDIEYHFDDNGKPIIDSILHGQAYTIAEGQRFAQMRLVQVPTASFVQVDSVANLGEDRGGGFGHTGE